MASLPRSDGAFNAAPLPFRPSSMTAPTSSTYTMTDLPCSNSAINAVPFPFMKLPAELRQQVYDCYFEDIGVMDKTKQRFWFDRIFDDKHQPLASIPRRAFPLDVLRPYLSLLHSNAKVRSEAAPIFYKDYIGSPEIPLVVRCDFCSEWGLRPLSRMERFSSSVATYNTDATLTIWFDMSQTPETLSIPSMEAVLNYMLQRTHLATDDSTFTRTVLLKSQENELRGWSKAVVDKILGTFSQIAEFELGHTPKRNTNDTALASLFVRGPLPKINWLELGRWLRFAHSEYLQDCDRRGMLTREVQLLNTKW